MKARCRDLAALALVLAVAGAAAADPIDDFLRSPGSTGDSVMAARMFAWCSAHDELLAWFEGQKAEPNQRRSDNLQEGALGARAAGAYRLYADWVEGGGSRAGGKQAQELDFSRYLSVVEGMAVQDGRDLFRRLAEAEGQPERLAATLGEIDAEIGRCKSGTLHLQLIQVGRMTKQQIAVSKARPRMISIPAPPAEPAP